MVKKRRHLLKDIRKYSHEHPLFKFTILLGIFILYLVFSTLSFGIENGILISILTWSFFVFCTPIASAGLLLDFPLRFITGLRMIFSEIIVWTIALIINLFVVLINPQIYTKTLVLQMFHQILTTPFPFWGIIILSGAGTFFSIYFGDEILDILVSKKKKRDRFEKHNFKHKIIILLSIIILAIILYYFLINKLNLNIPLF